MQRKLKTFEGFANHRMCVASLHGIIKSSVKVDSRNSQLDSDRQK